jgi:hypothetical protein
MNTNELIKATGRLNIQIIGPDGKVKEEQNVDNLVVTAGLGFIASRMRDASAAVMSHMAVGSGTGAAAAGNTTLGTELGRVALTSTTVTNNQVAFVATFGAGVGTGAVTEAGLFNAGSNGTMLCRTVFSVVNKEAADTMAITWTVTIGAA